MASTAADTPATRAPNSLSHSAINLHMYHIYYASKTINITQSVAFWNKQHNKFKYMQVLWLNYYDVWFHSQNIFLICSLQQKSVPVLKKRPLLKLAVETADFPIKIIFSSVQVSKTATETQLF